MNISIHALLAESDSKNLIVPPGLSLFLSTLSLRRATFYSNTTAQHVAFLSTLSLRRATFSAGREYDTEDYFYPRSPCGERRRKGSRRCVLSGISIHALLAESDYMCPIISTTILIISIHALLAESDRFRAIQHPKINISIHALLAESDRISAR